MPSATAELCLRGAHSRPSRPSPPSPPNAHLLCLWNHPAAAACAATRRGDLLRAAPPLPAPAFRAFLPRAARASLCLLSVFSADLLAPSSYGRHAAELHANWALAHAHAYLLFSAAPLAAAAPLAWAKPRALLLALTRTPCAHALLLDADAAPASAAASPALALAFLSPPARLLAACGGECVGCACAGGWCGGVAELAARAACAANSGVVLAANDGVGRRMVAWWAAAGTEGWERGEGRGGGRGEAYGWGGAARRGEAAAGEASGAAGEVRLARRAAGRSVCAWDGALAEQDCFNLMGAAFPRGLRLVGARELNTPAWQAAGREELARVGGQHGARFERVCARRGGGWEALSLRQQLECFNGSAFVCHAMGFLSVRRGRLELKRAALAAALAAHAARLRPTLRGMLAARGEPYREWRNLTFGGDM